MKHILVLVLSFFAFSLIGCSNDIYLKLNKDGSVDVKYSTLAGDALVDIFESFTTSTDSKDFFNPEEIKKDFISCGFSNVIVTKNGNTGFASVMKDKMRKSLLFSSKILTASNSSIKVKISPEVLFDFYCDSDEQTQMLLDMLLAPVFNEEEMTENEYIELISSVYGKSVGQEIQNSKVNIVLEDSNGTKVSRSFSLSKILTLNETIMF